MHDTDHSKLNLKNNLGVDLNIILKIKFILKINLWNLDDKTPFKKSPEKVCHIFCMKNCRNKHVREKIRYSWTIVVVVVVNNMSDD